jgi:hypothetical protein
MTMKADIPSTHTPPFSTTSNAMCSRHRHIMHINHYPFGSLSMNLCLSFPHYHSICEWVSESVRCYHMPMLTLIINCPINIDRHHQPLILPHHYQWGSSVTWMIWVTTRHYYWIDNYPLIYVMLIVVRHNAIHCSLRIDFLISLHLIDSNCLYQTTIC